MKDACQMNMANMTYARHKSPSSSVVRESDHCTGGHGLYSRAENLNVSLRDILNVTFCCLIHYQVTDLLLSVRLRESGASGENRPVVTERGGGNKWLFPCLLWYHISS